MQSITPTDGGPVFRGKIRLVVGGSCDIALYSTCSASLLAGGDRNVYSSNC